MEFPHTNLVKKGVVEFPVTDSMKIWGMEFPYIDLINKMGQGIFQVNGIVMT